MLTGSQCLTSDVKIQATFYWEGFNSKSGMLAGNAPLTDPARVCAAAWLRKDLHLSTCVFLKL